MAVEAGTRFGAYEVGEAIGAGGMGEVYRATDTTLERDVALKVLPASFAEDADRVTRFEREAKTLAALNHPNIAQIYGLEKSDGTTALVMELVDGATLGERIAKGPIPADEALGIAMQIADALEAAHGQNIVHRDLKPANIKLKADGTVKVLDFGIAKALAQESLTSEPQSPIMTTPATQVGVILGTAAYMSPEQAKGKAIDQRTDIWAFGCVLYEMLTGQLAFGAEDVPTTLARIIANDTNLDSLPAAISPAVRKTIELCLQKDVRKRLQSIGDARLALEGAFETVSAEPAGGAAVAAPLWRRVLPVAAAVIITAVTVGMIDEFFGSDPEPSRVSRLGVIQNPGQRLILGGFNHDIAISPDGTRVVYRVVEEGQPVLVVRELDSLEATVLYEGEVLDVFFSPDSEWVAVMDDVGVRRIPVDGGPDVEIARRAGSFPRGGTWSADDTIIYGTSAPSGLWQVPVSGGEAIPLTSVEDAGAESGTNHQWPAALPGGEAILYTAQPPGEGPNAAQIVLLDLITGRQEVLVSGGSDAEYVSTGHIVYGYDGTLRAVPFDLDRLEVTGNAVPVADGVATTSVGAADYSISQSGTLAYVRGSFVGGVWSLTWVDRQGREEVLTAEPSTYFYPRISWDGTRVAIDDRNAANDIWIWDIASATRRRLTTDTVGGTYPTWTPDDERIAWSPGFSAAGLYWKAANNTGAAEPIGGDSLLPLRPQFFTPSGEHLIVVGARTSGTEDDIGMIVMGDDAEPIWLLQGEYVERNPSLSPDGRWLAYESNEASGLGAWEVYVRPFPNVDDDQVQISNAGGEKPLWSRDGRELFYLEPGTPDRLISVQFEAIDSEFSLVERTPVMPWPYAGTRAAPGRTYDVSPDGDRFLALKLADGEEGREPEIIVVQNWFEELRRVAPTE